MSLVRQLPTVYCGLSDGAVDKRMSECDSVKSRSDRSVFHPISKIDKPDSVRKTSKDYESLANFPCAYGLGLARH